ncbi:MAG: hypothetical protein U0353_15060 [Sandaracinus sp.]
MNEPNETKTGTEPTAETKHEPAPTALAEDDVSDAELGTVAGGISAGFTGPVPSMPIG